MPVYRRTGGLENARRHECRLDGVYRRTGGLERLGRLLWRRLGVYRRTGGLENNILWASGFHRTENVLPSFKCFAPYSLI